MTEVSPARVGGAVVTYRVGGHEYPMRTVQRCKVCMSPYRFDIEEDLIAGRTYDKIAGILPEGAEISPRNVKDHYHNGHLPLDHAVTRQIVESRAQRVGKRIEDSAESLIDGVTLAEVVVQKTFEHIANGSVVPDIKDGLSAAKFLAEMGEYDEGGADMDAVAEAFIVYHEHAQQMMSEEQFEKFGRALSANPVLKALAARYEGETVVHGEVMEDEGEEVS